MFRYIALSWDIDDLAGLQSARQAELKLRRPGSGWKQVLSSAGLVVYVVGAKPGVNMAYVLPRDQGVILGKLFRRSDLERPHAENVSLTDRDAEQIVKSHGRNLIDGYWGRYVAILRDTSAATCILREPCGTLPCYLTRHGGVRIVFSWLEDVLALIPELANQTVNWDYIAVHIPAYILESRETAIHGVTQVIAGEAVRVGRDGTTYETYWNPVEFARSEASENPALAAAALRTTVRGCVQSWAGCYGNLVLRLSGGVDSSIVVSCLPASTTSIGVTCVNYYSAGSDTDERRFARLAAARAGRDLIEREREFDFTLERILEVARTPAPSFYLGRIMADRTDTSLAASLGAFALFSGAGGDQLFVESTTHSSAADYLRSHGFGPGFFSAAMDAARLGRVSVWRALGFAFRDRFRFGSPELRADIGKYLGLVTPDVVASARRDRRFLHPALQNVEGVPPAKLGHIEGLIYPTEYYDPIGQQTTLEQVHPLLSQPVIELCLRLPVYILVNGGRGRALARQAFRQDLPPEIAQRRSKGGMEEYVDEILQRNKAFVRGMLLDGELVRQGIIDRTRLEEVLSGRPTTIESANVELHTYLGIEAWLSRWRTSTQRAAA